MDELVRLFLGLLDAIREEARWGELTLDGRCEKITSGTPPRNWLITTVTMGSKTSRSPADPAFFSFSSCKPVLIHKLMAMIVKFAATSIALGR